MSDAFITAGTTGKDLQTYLNTVSGRQVHSEAVTPTDTTGAPFTSSNAFPVKIVHALVMVPHDEIVLSSYTTDNQPRTVTYKSSTVTVATLTLTYSGGAAGGNLLSVVRS